MKKLNSVAIFFGLVLSLAVFMPLFFAHAQSADEGDAYNVFSDTSSYSGDSYYNPYADTTYNNDSYYNPYVDTSSSVDTSYAYPVDTTSYSYSDPYVYTDNYNSGLSLSFSSTPSYSYTPYTYYPTYSYSTPTYNYNTQPVVNNNNLSVSCYAGNSSVDTNTSVTWNSSVSGGNGNYVYAWSGTDGLSGSGSSITQSYNYTGTKTATLTVTSNGYSRTANCGYVNVGNNNNNNNGSLGVSCSISDTSVNVGDSIHVYANGYGGNGNYTYTWSGDYPVNGRYGSDQYYSYDSNGNKDVSVTVYSNGNSVTRDCGTVYVGSNYYSGYSNSYYNNNYGNLNISCTVNKSTAAVGEFVNWTTSVTGGNSNYTYYWSGADGASGYGPTLSKSFNTTGVKTPTVTVTSNGYTRSLNCPTVNVGGVAAGNLASLSSVYLNQVPYTGVGDNLKFAAFLSGLILWSAMVAYFIIKRKATTDRKSAILAFKQENLRRLGK